jgi:hypothetical protein
VRISAGADVWTVVIHGILSFLLAIPPGAGNKAEAAPSGQHNQDNRGIKYGRTATAATALIVGFTIDAPEGDLETKVGLIRSFLQHTLRRVALAQPTVVLQSLP